MSNTIYIAPQFLLWSENTQNVENSDDVFRSMPFTDRHDAVQNRSETFTLLVGETRNILTYSAKNAAIDYVFLKVTGEVTVNTTGKDYDGVTAITGITNAYGTAYLPAIICICTYNLITLDVVGIASGSTVEVLNGLLVGATDPLLLV
jgi:hypothetical protein